MDEPLSNLDALLRLQMRAELKGILQESRTTTIYVTHDQVEAMSLADRIAIMHGGEIVQYDAPLRVYQDPATVFCGGFIGNPPMNFLPAQRIDGAGRWRVGESALPGPSPAVGAPVNLLLGIRPEDLRLAPEPGPDRLSGQVGVVEPLGPNTLFTVQLGGQIIRVAAAPDVPVRHGDTVHLEPRPDRLRWFDAETQKALAP
jgi:multiple sugar transport system ATP-binding protein